MADRNPDLLASDADRDRVVSVLRDHMVAGRLDLDGFSKRMGQALEVTTLEDLDQLLRDLPATPAPVLAPRTRRQRAAVRTYQKQLASWEQIRAIKQSHLDLAQGGGDTHHIEFPCAAGERILTRTPRTTLRVWTTTAGHTERRTTSSYSRNVFGGGRRTGTTRTYQVPGRDVQVTADVGVLYVTNRRIGFRGPKRTLDIPINFAAGVSVDPKARRIVVSVSNSRPVTFRYPKDSTGNVAFSIHLALAHSQGASSPLVAGLESELAELDRNKPVLPPEALEPPAKRVVKREPRRVPPNEDGWRPVAETNRGSSLGAFAAFGLLGAWFARRRVAETNQANSQVATRTGVPHNWWVLLTLPLGLTTWAAFLYAGRRAKRPDLVLAAAGYGVALVVWLVLAGTSHSGTAQSSAAGVLGVIAWMAGIVHAFVVRRKVGRKLAVANAR